MDNTKLKGRMSGKVQELQQPAGNQTINTQIGRASCRERV